ncbi:MAG: UDP-N-acetylmuramoyl-tripeptide--D-alanyl-D-alanine ligase [Parcubacteria group bacterium]|nr:UDP-N-acetylmuramoyl-tripeptide--D-alanyl-D-alanine ligase [Parcubacteria group bacterium]
MKKILRNVFASMLASLARGVLLKYKPTVVMVTGSVGKTSTKDAIAAVLDSRFYIRASEKSYNSEFGVPLTILGAKNPWASPYAWVKVFGEALALHLFPNHYPKILVLEVGADRPGDLARILRIATPNIVVVTQLPAVPVHVEAYATPAAVRDEEFAPAYALSPDGCLVYSADDDYVQALAKPLAVKVTSYGVAKSADVRLSGAAVYIEGGIPAGMESMVAAGGNEYVLRVNGALGRPQLLAPAAAIAVACELGMTVKEALKGLEAYVPPAGRGRLLAGKNGATIIDDSYNASPAAVEEGLASLQILADAHTGMRRIAALGDMLELGRYSSREHEQIGTSAAQRCDVLITVGSRSRATAESAIVAGMKEDCVHQFETSRDAADFLKDFIQKNDAILIKGSQSVRMERIAEVLLANPADRKYLVRQDVEWKRR